MTLTEADWGKTIETGVGSVITIRLKENPSTAFRWSVESATGLTVVENRFEPCASAIGGAGIRTLSFRTSSPGSYNLRLSNRRQWEPEASAVDRFQVQIVAK